MARNTGKWTIHHDNGMKDVTFNTRKEAADYASEQQRKGNYALEVATPDGRTGTLGSQDGTVPSQWTKGW